MKQAFSDTMWTLKLCVPQRTVGYADCRLDFGHKHEVRIIESRQREQRFSTHAYFGFRQTKPREQVSAVLQVHRAPEQVIDIMGKSRIEGMRRDGVTIPGVQINSGLEYIDYGEECTALIDQGVVANHYSTVESIVGSQYGVNVKVEALSGYRGVVSSDGVFTISPRNRATISVVVRGTDDAGVHGVQCFSRVARDWNALELCLESLQLEVEYEMRRLRDGGDCPEGKFPVVLSPRAAAYIVHEAFGHLCEADRIAPNKSAEIPNGMKLAERFVTVLEEPTGQFTCSSPYDDEGVKRKQIALMVDGQWTGLLHTRETANIWKTEPNGCARCTSALATPKARMCITRLVGGSSSKEELLKGISRGIYVDRPYIGELSRSEFKVLGQTAFLIEKGRITKPLKPVTLMGKPLTILNSISAVANDEAPFESSEGCSRGDQKNLPVGMIAPSIRLSSMDVGRAVIN